VFTAIDCDDHNPCTVDECVNGQCVHQLITINTGGELNCVQNHQVPDSSNQQSENYPGTPNLSNASSCGVGGGSGGLAALASLTGFQALRTRRKR
jgi:hypothetical protein